MASRRRLLNISDAADALGIHRASLHRWIKKTLEGTLEPPIPLKWTYVDGKGRPIPPWHFDLTELKTWLNDYQRSLRPGRNPGR